MSKERELLQRCLDEFDYKGVACIELCIDIYKLLTQPELEQEVYTKGYAEAMRQQVYEAFEAGRKSITSEAWNKEREDAMIEDESAPYDMSIHSNPSALAWTTFFREHNPDCNVDDDVIMLAWFANAMMAMHDHIYQSTQPEQTEQDTLTRQQGIEKYKRTQAKE